MEITNTVKYIGVDDKTLDLFESQYIVPNGMAYNSYLIKGEQNIVVDTVDKRATDDLFSNLERVLEGEKADYLIISHLEPDHSANIQKLAEKISRDEIDIKSKNYRNDESIL